MSPGMLRRDISRRFIIIIIYHYILIADSAMIVQQIRRSA